MLPTLQLLTGLRSARAVLPYRATRKVVKLLSSTLQSACVYVDANEISFVLWDTTVDDFDAWSIWIPQPYIIIRHVEKYDVDAFASWSGLLAEFDLSASIQIYSETSPISWYLWRNDSRSRFGIEYKLEEGLKYNDAFALAQTTLSAWNLPNEILTINEVDANGMCGFEAKMQLPGGKLSVSPWTDNPLWPFPRKLRINAFDSLQDAIRAIIAAVNKMPPQDWEMRFQGQVAKNRFQEFSPRLQNFRDRWWYIIRGSYRSAFDPFVGLEQTDSSKVQRYPILTTMDSNRESAMQIDVVHMPEESFLDFQTTGGDEVLEQYLQIVRDHVRIHLGKRLAFERWQGSFHRRWQGNDGE